VVKPPQEKATLLARASVAGGNLAVLTGDDRVALFRLSQPAEPALVLKHSGVASVVLSPDGRWVATGTRRGTGVKVWDAWSGELVRDLAPKKGMSPVAFSPDGHWLVTSTRQAYQFWEAGPWAAGPRIERESGERDGVVAFSLDGTVLAVGIAPERIRLVDGASGDRLATLELPDPRCVSSLCFSPDATQLVAATDNGRIYCWDLYSIRQGLAGIKLDWEQPLPDRRKAAEQPKQIGAEVCLFEPGEMAAGVAANERQDSQPLPIDVPDDMVTFRYQGNISDWFFLAMACWEIGRKDDAYNWYVAATEFLEEKAPGDEELHLLRDEAARALGLPLEAEAQHNALKGYTGSIRLLPHDIIALNEKGTVALERKEWDQAISYYTRAIRVDPTLAVLYHSRAKAYRMKADLERAIEDYTKAIDRAPTWYEPYASRGIAHLRQGDLQQAMVDLREALRLNPQSVESHVNLGYLYSETGQFDEAISCYTNAIRLDASVPLAYNNRGAAHLALGDLDQAVVDCTEAIWLDRNCAPAHKNRAEARRRRGELQQAIADATRAIWLDPELAEAYCTRALAQATLEKLPDAQTDVDKAAALRPTSPNTLVNLVLFLADCPDPRLRRVGRAVELATEATKQWPKSGAALAALGVAHYRAGNWAEAKQALPSSSWQ